MSVTLAPGSFACEQCGKQFKWKAAIAGKSAKCGCGARVEVPTSEPGVRERDPDNVFDGFDDIMPLAAAPAPIARPTVVPPIPKATPKGKAVAGKGGSKPGGPAGKSTNPLFQSRAGIGPTAAELAESRNPSFWGRPKDKIAPFIIIGVSLAITFGMAAYQANQLRSGGAVVMGITLVYSLLCVVGLVGAAFVSAGVGGLSFGIMGIAILRLAAISFACTALDALMVFGGMWWLIFVRGIITYAIFTFGLMTFFDLEYQETRVVAFVATFVKWLMRVGLIALITGMAASSSASDDSSDFEDHDDDAPMVSIDRSPAKSKGNTGKSAATTRSGSGASDPEPGADPEMP